MKAVEVRRLSLEELNQRIDDSADDVFRMRFLLISGQLQNTMSLKQTRQEVARMKTIIRERELQINQESTEEEG